MLQQHDTLVVWLLIILGIVLICKKIYDRYFFAIPKESLDPNDDLITLLNRHGYTTINRKVRVPIRITKDEHEHMESRYYIDAIARKDGFTYAVKVSRTKKPMEYTNSSIRDHLFPIYLLAAWDGVIYVDKEIEKVLLFTFTYDRYNLPKKKPFISHIIMFLCGIIFTLFIL